MKTFVWFHKPYHTTMWMPKAIIDAYQNQEMSKSQIIAMLIDEYMSVGLPLIITVDRDGASWRTDTRNIRCTIDVGVPVEVQTDTETIEKLIESYIIERHELIMEDQLNSEDREALDKILRKLGVRNESCYTS